MKRALVFSVLFSSLCATTINIPSDYTTIQEGIDASVDGDTVLIAEGTYYENLILEKEIVLASHAIYDDLDSDWLNNLTIQETIISGAQEASDPNKGSCLVIRGSGWGYSGNPRPEIMGLTFQDGTGTSMKVNDCNIIRRERSGGAILIYDAYPTIMYNRFLNNGLSNDTGGNNPTNIETANGGAIGHYSSEDVEFDEDRSFSRRNNNQNNNSARTYVRGNPAAADAYNNEMNFRKNQGSGRLSEKSSYKELEEMVPAARYYDNDTGERDDADFVPGVRGDLMIYMHDSYGDGWNGNELTIGEHTFTIENGYYAEAALTLDDGTYAVTCGGGSWQEEVSWQIVDAADGTELLAGGAPFEGGFELGGDPPQDVPDTLFIQNNYFEGNSSGDGENFYSFGFDGSIDVSHSVFEDIDCETNSVNDFVLRSLQNTADYVQNGISGNCIESNSFYVSNSGDDNNAGTESEPLKTIGHALTLVKDGATVTTINLASGVYSPSTNGEIFPIVLPDNVHLIGDDRETTILDAEANANKEAAVMIINEVENVTVANLTLTGGYSEGHGCTGGGALLVTANDTENMDWEMETNLAVLDNLIIENSHSHNGGGLSLFRVDGPTVSNLIVRNNTASLMGGGIFVYVADVTMSGIEIYDNYCIGAYADDCGNDCGHGGGLFLNQSWGTYDEMYIHDNTASMNGGGVWSSFGSAWTMTNSTVSNNVAPYNGGGFGFWDHNGEGLNATLINVTVENNVAQQGWWVGFGGGVWANNSSTVFEDCSFINNVSNNNGGAVNYWGGSSSPVFKNTIFDGNSATSYGGAIYIAEDAGGFHVEYCTFVDNSASVNGGAIDVSRNGDVINSTFSGNSTGEYGTISIGQPTAYVDVYNSILWNDNIEYEFGGYVGNFNVVHSDIEGGWEGGTGNINSDPLFTDADNGDFTLQPGSPCIDAGTADTDNDWEDDITDYNGSAPDMGAFEYFVAGPTGLQFSIEGASVTLTWDPITDDNLINYSVERSTDSLFATDIVVNLAQENFFTDDDLEWDTEYYYRVFALVGPYNSYYSEVISVTLEWLGVDNDGLPTSYMIHQNYPNPFNPVTTLRYDLPEDALVNITIYDMMGRQVSKLVSSQQSAGYKSVQWNATNDAGSLVSAGLYLYMIQAGDFKQTKKMILLK